MKDPIDSLIDWLDKGNEILNLHVENDARQWVDKHELLAKARELAAEPRTTASAGLVEALESILADDNSGPCCSDCRLEMSIKEIIAKEGKL